MVRQVMKWQAKDGTYHDRRVDAEKWDDYCALRQAIEDMDLDWRDGIHNPATPDSIAAGLLEKFDFNAKPTT